MVSAHMTRLCLLSCARAAFSECAAAGRTRAVVHAELMCWVPAESEPFHAAAQVQRFLNAWIQGTDVVQYTPGGFAWSSAWGSLRYTANAALVAVVYASHINGESPPHHAHHAVLHLGSPETRGAVWRTASRGSEG